MKKPSIQEKPYAYLEAGGATVPGEIGNVSRITLGGATVANQMIFLYDPAKTPGSIAGTNLYRETEGTIGIETLIALDAIIDFRSSSISCAGKH